ncbi:MAG: MBL fold metallo-hydrolase [Desulfobacteraceae bacterium]|jgi:7,8-dihydropterin-6-yl-methyl-4-(beta-D-ribofuranosyl)aminobenzene 5'-phosphate synthase
MIREKNRITILVDNTSGPGMICEHGLAFYIESEGRHILFDTGQGEALLPNTRSLGKDLRNVEMLVLSHGHYDHSGAVDQVLSFAPSLKFYAHPGVVQPRYSIVDGNARGIQMPSSSFAAINRVAEENVNWISEPFYLTPKIGITGPIPRETQFEDTGGPFYLDPQGQRKDPIMDDLALWIKADHGLVILAGCAHSGLVNTINYICALNNQEVIRAIIGGFHLINAGDYRLRQTISVLSSETINRIIPCHCTGEYAINKLQNELGSKVTKGLSGMTYSF